MLAVLLLAPLHAAEYHVAVTGNDANSGSQSAPLRTIQHAADLAQPGDVITVHEGVYRERIKPPRGGVSDQQRIVYQTAPGERVTITGSPPWNEPPLARSPHATCRVVCTKCLENACKVH